MTAEDEPAKSSTELPLREVDVDSDDGSTSTESTESEHEDDANDLEVQVSISTNALDLGHNMPKEEHLKLYDQLAGPHRHQYRRIMRKKPREKYLQITKGTSPAHERF